MKYLSLRTLSVLCILALLLSGGSPALAAEPTGEGFELPQLTDLPVLDVTDPLFKLANSYNSIGYEYALSEFGSFEGQLVNPLMADALKEMVSAARAEGVKLYVSVAYRNGEFLTNNYLILCDYYGALEACRRLPPGGCNEHQTGLAIDVTERMEYSCLYQAEFDDSSVYESPVYDWMMEHCVEYGFIPRYPEGKEAWYGDRCPHFHFRYVGVEVASYLTEHDLCLEELLYLEDPDCLFVPGLTSYATF